MDAPRQPLVWWFCFGLLVFLAGSCGVDVEGPLSQTHPRQRAQWTMPNSQANGLPHEVSYRVDADLGVVQDDVTGLMWERKGPVFDSVEEAIAYCTTSELGGYLDWRLPTRIEVLSIFDHSQLGPDLAQGVFEDAQKAAWTSTRVLRRESYVPQARLDFFRQRLSTNESAGPPTQAICTRSHRAVHIVPDDRRYELHEAFVDDVATGLRWAVERSEAGTFADHFSYCVQGAFDGEDGWRLPSYKELHTIWLLGEDPGIDEAIFPGGRVEKNPEFERRWDYVYRSATKALNYQNGSGTFGLVGLSDATVELQEEDFAITRCVKTMRGPL